MWSLSNYSFNTVSEAIGKDTSEGKHLCRLHQTNNTLQVQRDWKEPCVFLYLPVHVYSRLTILAKHVARTSLTDSRFASK